MSTKTKIEWCDATVNPIVGCSKCSPGCDNCYAEKRAYRLSRNELTAKKYAGVVDERGRWTGKINSVVYWADRNMPHRVPGKNKRVFVGSMTDLFHPNVGQERLDTIFASILFDSIVTNGHGHSYIVVTKRVDRMLEYFEPGPEAMLRRWGEAGNGWLHVGDGDETFSEYAEGQTIPQPGHEKYPNLLHKYFWPLPNLWTIATICNQAEADEKIPLLLQVPSVKRGVSVEPMLGPVEFPDHFLKEHCRVCKGTDRDYTGCSSSVEEHFCCNEGCDCTAYPWDTHWMRGLDWVICGGETGPKARPMHPGWPLSLRDQCQDAGVPFFFKGWGAWYPALDAAKDMLCEADGVIVPDGRYCAYDDLWDECKAAFLIDLRTYRASYRKEVKRLLDGREWSEVPV